MPEPRASGHGFPWSGRRATAIHMAKAWRGEEEEEEDGGGWLVPVHLVRAVAFIYNVRQQPSSTEPAP